MTSLKVLIAPDSFKGSLSATEVASAIAEGWLAVRPGDVISIAPLADGGEGTVDAIHSAVPGAVRRDAGEVRGPDSRPVRGEWLRLPDGTAVVELAQSSGLPLMAELDPLRASTFGLGQVIAAALDDGARRLIIGLGGSASTDAGTGALAALGLRSDTGSLDSGGGGLLDVSGVDSSLLRAAPEGGVVLLTDVRAPLLGNQGAAAVFGPQKGASEHDIDVLETALTHFADGFGGSPAAPGSGAAGGTAYGFATAWSATIEPGAEYISGLIDVVAKATEADIVLTGEGCFDATSLTGKLVGHVIRVAAGTATVGVIAGDVRLTPTTADGNTLWSLSLVQLAGSTSAAMSDAARWLRQAGESAARQLAPQTE
ncbi:glycerate kinase [soil metagenome]